MVPLRTHFGGFGNRLFQLAYIYAKARDGEIPDIYLQDTGYFQKYRGELQSIFMQGVEPIDMVSLHVRRGDYLKSSFYVDLAETSYYDDAIDTFPPDTKFLVFCADRQPGSDDISDMEWCKQRFPNKNFEFFQGKDEMEDWNAMAGCRAHIIANSSFSFWAAYSSGKPTVYPTKWYTDGVERTKFIAPDNWTKI